MDSLNIYKASGVAVGVIVGLVNCVVLFRFMNRDKKIFTKYDERQSVARGKAYMYAFWAMMIAVLIIILLDTAGITVANRFTTDFFAIFVGIIVQVTYSIWNDAYYGINTNKKRFIIVSIVAALFNLIPVIGSIKGGNFIENGVVSDFGTNLLVFILMIIIGIELFIKDRIDSSKSSVEESEDDE